MSRRSGARRSSCCRTAKTRRACCRSKKCSIWRSVPKPRSTRSACARAKARARRPRASRKPSSCCGNSRRKPAAARSFPLSCRARVRVRSDFRRALEPVHGRLYVAKPQTRRRLAPRCRAREPAEHDGAHQAGILRADIALTHEHRSARPVRRGARRLCWHFAQRNPAVGRSATTLLVAAALAHTFAIGMQTTRLVTCR